MIIGIDGPAGSGKTTVAKLLAKKLGIFYLDTGAMYRALTLRALEEGVDLYDQDTLKKLAEGLNIEFRDERVYLDQVDVSDQIRTPLIDKSISPIVAQPEVRAVMVRLQRSMVERGSFVVEGRDITTVVFPDAKYKFYLDASEAIRVQRRFKELKGKGLDVNLQELDKDLKQRDESDKTREISPLRISEDALCIDTTNLTIAETAEEIIKHIDKEDK